MLGNAQLDAHVRGGRALGPAPDHLERARVELGEPAAMVPSALPSMLITTLSPGMQCTVCGRV